MDRWQRMFWGLMDKKDDDEGGGDKGEDVAKKLLEQARRLVTKEGSAESALVALLEDNKSLRDKNNALKERVPGEGSVVLSKDDAQLFDKVKKLGKYEDVEKAVKEHPTLVEFKTSRERTDAVRDAARLMEWNPDVLVDIVNARSLALEFKTEKVKEGEETKTVTVPYVKVAGATDAVALRDYAKDKLGDYMTVLSKAPEKENGGGGRKFPGQESSNKGKGGGDTVTKFITDQQTKDKGKFNPLRPEPAAASK